MEKTNERTVVAAVSLVSKAIFSVALERSEKQLILKSDRNFFRRKTGYLRTFAFLVAVAARVFLGERDSYLVVDTEYPGHESEIRYFTVKYLKKLFGVEFPPSRVLFEKIGKGSLAHKNAIAVFRGSAKPSRTLTAGKILNEI
ncbi:MAG: hypothetical protein V1820_04490 [archaeon]